MIDRDVLEVLEDLGIPREDDFTLILDGFRLGRGGDLLGDVHNNGLDFRIVFNTCTQTLTTYYQGLLLTVGPEGKRGVVPRWNSSYWCKTISSTIRTIFQEVKNYGPTSLNNLSPDIVQNMVKYGIYITPTVNLLNITCDKTLTRFSPGDRPWPEKEYTIQEVQSCEKAVIDLGYYRFSETEIMPFVPTHRSSLIPGREFVYITGERLTIAGRVFKSTQDVKYLVEGRSELIDSECVVSIVDILPKETYTKQSNLVI